MKKIEHTEKTKDKTYNRRTKDKMNVSKIWHK